MTPLTSKDLDFSYPPELIAQEPSSEWKAMLWSQSGPETLKPAEVLEQFKAGDLLVVNDTRVMKRRVFSEEGLEILFLEALGEGLWSVLFPAKKMKVGDSLVLPKGIRAELVEKGLPQKLKVEKDLDEKYFESQGELALPPYIQSRRGERHNRQNEELDYQTEWAEVMGSFAAPTASLHFSKEDLNSLKTRGVQVLKVTLHVGLGTFLPISCENLEDHKMHSESAFISREVVQQLEAAMANGDRIWALGTTVTRTLESWAHGLLKKTNEGDFQGGTELFIKPGFEFKCVNGLLTNFHQPKSTLLALVGAFAGLNNVFEAYQWAIQNKFRLFSYGDLSIWTRFNCPNKNL